ncbi:MAG: hypothetical protein RLN77_09745, partial [Rhodospirillales bacterium]
ICDQLIGHGLAPDTPAAAINQGTRPDQRTVHAPLKDLAGVVEGADLSGATLLVIGKVVGLAPDLAWFNPGHLEGGEADSVD